MKVLIIEDEYSLADAISETLKKENFIVNIITNGEDGENEALTNVYDLILLDIMLPNKNGFEILEALRREKIETPIIMLTAKSEMSDKLNGLENGADDYITKPIGNMLLQNEIESSQIEQEEISNNFGKGVPMQMNFGGNTKVQSIDTIDAVVDFTVIMQLLGIGIGLTLISSLASMISIQRFSPLTILKERS